jgi:hypothetical protein
MKRFVLGVVAAGTLVGCAGPREIVRQRAAFDFTCPETTIATQQLPGGGMGAIGCGKKASYVWTGNAWALNSPITETTETPAPDMPHMPPENTCPQKDGETRREHLLRCKEQAAKTP